MAISAHIICQPSGNESSRGKPMTQLIALISSFRHEDEGQGLAEYALILALIAIVAIVALIFLGGQVSSILKDVGTSV
jgi:pilus assembly protein Flp/PilA